MFPTCGQGYWLRCVSSSLASGPLTSLTSLTSVLVKRVLGHRAERGDPKPLLFQIHIALGNEQTIEFGIVGQGGVNGSTPVQDGAVMLRSRQ